MSNQQVLKLYENLKELQLKGLLDISIKNGIISSNYYDYISIYESYKRLRLDGEYKMQAYQKVATDHFLSVDNVRKIIARFK